MTPEDPLDRALRQIEGLMTSYGALLREQGRHDERLDGHAHQLAARREELRALPERIERAMRSVDDHCEKRHNELKETIEELEDRLEAKIEGVEARIMRQRERQEMTIKEKVTLFAALISGPSAAFLVWLLNGGSS